MLICSVIVTVLLSLFVCFSRKMLASWSTYLLTFSLPLEMVKFLGVAKNVDILEGRGRDIRIFWAHFGKSRVVGGQTTNPFYIYVRYRHFEELHIASH